MIGSFDIIIEDLGVQGDGIAHHDNQTLFVAGALPDEQVRVASDERLENQLRARLLDILKPSPHRTVPPCPHFLTCGGCRLQHLDALFYADWKTRQLTHRLEQAGLDTTLLKPLVVSPPGTRRRARLAAKHGKDSVVLGFNEWRSHKLVDVQACPVLMPKLAVFIQALRPLLPSVLPRSKSCDLQITLLPDGIDVVLIGGPPLTMQQREKLAMLADALNIQQLSWRKWDRSPVEPVAHRIPLMNVFGETPVPFPPGSFLQATAAGEQALIDFSRNALQNSKNIADLFCGLGGFGLSIPQATNVTFADIDGPAIAALERAVKGNPRMNVERRNLVTLPYTAEALNEFDAVLFDPPRGGAKAQASQLADSRVPEIVAISCDPPSFARDANILLQGGYTLHAIQPVDQFLWSTHLELAAYFSR